MVVTQNQVGCMFCRPSTLELSCLQMTMGKVSLCWPYVHGSCKASSRGHLALHCMHSLLTAFCCMIGMGILSAGGTFALYSLLCRAANITPTGSAHASDAVLAPAQDKTE